MLLQPIRVQAAPGSVKTAILHVFEMDAAVANVAEKRVCAMHQRNPMHTFMFDGNGKLLDANQGALEAFQQDQAGRHQLQCKCCDAQSTTYRQILQSTLCPA